MAQRIFTFVHPVWPPAGSLPVPKQESLPAPLGSPCPTSNPQLLLTSSTKTSFACLLKFTQMQFAEFTFLKLASFTEQI